MQMDSPAEPVPAPGLENEIDVSSELPSERAVVETTSVVVDMRVFKIRFRTAGKRTWAPALCIAVLGLAVLAGIAYPLLLVPAETELWLRLTTCTVVGGGVFLAGAALVIYLLKRSR